MTAQPSSVPEQRESLWRLAFAPALWLLHFFLCYLTAAIWCAKAGSGASLGGVRFAIWGYTAAAVAAIVAIGWNGFRRHAYGHSLAPHDEDTPEDRHRFLGLATVLLAGLSAVATSYTAMVSVFFESCR
ncbi:MAG TPA: hypothetical protein VHR17_05300 [Thermoanaerobaculia bacterium]|jgi:hypothetical protein|nr:hypothetical protein [Thermoanaerobaculia bacterium]